MKTEEKIRAILVYDCAEPIVEYISNDLDTFQEIVEGYIEVVRMSDNVFMVCNEEGKIRNFSVCRYLRDENDKLVDAICGPFFLVADGGEEFASLNDDDIKYWTHYFTEISPPMI